MAATKSQGVSVTLFMIGFTSAGAGVAYFSSGMGKAAFVIGAAFLALSFWQFFAMKPLEGKIARKPQPAGLMLAGLAVNIVGWLTIVCSVHLTQSVGGRMAGAILGLAISLVGICGILPAASNKNAIWKA
jgi:uncharacterized membrane protein